MYKRQVAAYTRVSSDSDDQRNSFAAQNRYYAELISGKAEWRMVDIYADEGITGTSAAKREDFQRMMADCRRGLIDQILVKSISRFARNTKDCLEAVRELIALLEDGPDFLDRPDTELCGALVAEIIVESNDTLRFLLHNGLELRESIERTVR